MKCLRRKAVQQSTRALGAYRQLRAGHTQDATTVCRCDEVAYYGVQECLHSRFILGRAPALPRASHRASETPRLLDRCRYPDVSTSWSQQSTKLRCKSCKHVMTGAAERLAEHYSIYAQVSGRSVVIATTRTQQRTARDCSSPALHFALCVADLPRNMRIFAHQRSLSALLPQRYVVLCTMYVCSAVFPY